MPAARQDVDYAPPSNLSPWHSLLLRLPRLNSGQSKARLVDRLRDATLKPAEPEMPAQSRGAYELSGEELEIEEKRANDKERAIGLVAGPLATIIAFLVVHTLVVNDPSASLSDGAVNKLHVSLSTYSHVFLVLIILSFGITAMALWRKRLFMGIVTSLYGLTIFNLHYWGFGVPFVMVGAWYLVRTYRLQRKLKEATAGGPSVTSRSTPNKRYTPPTRSR
jgi:hypothetical protein